MNRNLALLLCFFFSHAIFHFLSHSFAVLLPSIRETFQVSAVQIGALITVRELGSGLISLPGGMISDYFSDRRGLFLTVCLLMFALGWLIVGSAPLFLAIHAGILLIAAAGALWHLPSLVELGGRFPHRRGTVFAVHGAGGSLGDIVGPIATGFLLASLSWREILSCYAIPPLVIALWTYLLFRRLSEDTAPSNKDVPRPPRYAPKEHIRLSLELFKTTDIWLINVVAGLRTMCFTVIITFLPMVMHDSGFSAPSIGFHFGLLWVVGLVASPVMGYLSDRCSRKVVLVPALLYSSLLVSVIGLYGTGPMFTVLIVLLGFSIRSDYSLINAAIIDIVKGKAENTMLGILTFSRSMMGAVAPLMAGFLYQYHGMRPTFLFVGVLFLAAAILFSRVRLLPRMQETP